MKHGGNENKVEIIYEKGKQVKIECKNIRGKTPLSEKKQAEAIAFVKKYHREISSKWTELMIFKKTPKFDIVKGKI